MRLVKMSSQGRMEHVTAKSLTQDVIASALDGARNSATAINITEQADKGISTRTCQTGHGNGVPLLWSESFSVNSSVVKDFIQRCVPIVTYASVDHTRYPDHHQHISYMLAADRVSTSASDPIFEPW